jgi:hypothetical protein
MQATRSSHHTLKFDSEFVTYIWSSVLWWTQFETRGKLQRVHSERSSKVPAGTPNTITQVILTQTWPTLDVQNFVEDWRISCAAEMINLFCALRRRQWRSGLQKIVCYFNKISNVLFGDSSTFQILKDARKKSSVLFSLHHRFCLNIMSAVGDCFRLCCVTTYWLTES